MPGTDEPAYDFLKTEYTQCVDLIKFYDNRQHDLVKFASGLAAAVPTVILTFRALTGTAAESVWSFTALVAIVTAVSLLTIFTALVQNRIYFIFAARQANGIRNKLLGGVTNHMYPTYEVPAFAILSSQTLQYAFVALQVGIFFGIAYYGRHDDGTGSALSGAIETAIFASAAPFALGAIYLAWRGETPRAALL